MLDHHTLLKILAMTIAGAPALLLIWLGLSSLVDRPLSERTTSRLVAGAVFTGLAAAIGVLVAMIVDGTAHLTVDLVNWITIPHFHFSVKFLFDRLSLPFVMLTFVLCGTIGSFASKYLHREPGYNRFFFLYSMFMMGMITTALAATIETLFVGWELVGLSSALLVAFFQERPTPVRNGLRVWTVYRISDAALLVAAVALHHLSGEGDFDKLLGTSPWPLGQATLGSSQALIIGLLLVVAAAGKSALVPFSGWLPRAMEGPTPSSAVFYGALSVHLGAYLLLRVSPILALSPALCWIIVGLGLATALFAALASRVQSDIKCALSFASLTQVGLIVAEIGLGLRWIALAHLLGHAFLRTLQFLRAPTLLHDYHVLENAIGHRPERRTGSLAALVPDSVRLVFYRFALEKGYLDAWLSDYIARPFLAVFRWCDARERNWTDFLSSGASRESDALSAAPERVEEFL